MKAFFRASSGGGSGSGRSAHSGRSDSGSGNMLMLGGLEAGDLNQTATPLL